VTGETNDLQNKIPSKYLRLPHSEQGQRIGLFGGSFNPPHEGHLLVSEIALKRLQLDQIWWIITPGNPLKDINQLAPLTERINYCEDIANHPSIKITAFELAHPTRFTADTLEFVKIRRPDANFVWIMGADNLASFHKWQRWQDIANMMPLAVIDRPGSTLSSRSSMAALAFSRFRLDESDAALLPSMPAPAWTFVHGPRSSLSSTKIRNGFDFK
jgi:nicotinate-nucleotide adenylyltransferase